MSEPLKIHIEHQPDDVTCGPVALQAVYKYWNDIISIDKVIDEVECIDADGGTTDALLGLHALQRGYSVCIYPSNLNIFDPTWGTGHKADGFITSRLKERIKYAPDAKTRRVIDAYIRFTEAGGEICIRNLDDILEYYLKCNCYPTICAVSSTALYNCSRDLFDGNVSHPDDTYGDPCGHFVIATSMDDVNKKVEIADPYAYGDIGNNYTVDFGWLMKSIYLGVSTFDGSLISIKPRDD